MKAKLILFSFLITMLINPLHYSEPGFNGPAPSCGGSGCHSSQAGILSAVVQSNLQVRITLSGTTSSVGGELVNESGTVVAVNNSTGNNPFTLTAPSAGTYKVNAGYKNPSRVWDSTTVVITLTDIGDNLIESTPHTYKLYNNYPNPFNPSTKINYAIPQTGFITLLVYNVLGSVVATLVNEVKRTGNYEIEFDASHLSSGVYYYSLSSGEFIETKKMILLR